MPADSYAPMFDPTLSGLSVGDLLAAAKDQKFQAYKCNLVGYRRAVRACENKAGMYEREAEDRWLCCHPPTVRIHPDGHVSAPGSKEAVLDFMGHSWRPMPTSDVPT